MKKFLLSILVIALSFGAEAQLVPLKVYNGMPFTIKLSSVVVRNTATCGTGSITFPAVAIPPGGIYTVAPILPGNALMDWAGAKISDLANTSYLRAIHPFFEPCWLSSVSGGAVTMTGYWYPIGASPYQVLKIYPF